MKTKSFDDYLKKRLSEDEIAEIEEMARLEYLSLKALDCHSCVGACEKINPIK